MPNIKKVEIKGKYLMFPAIGEMPQAIIDVLG